MIFNNVKNKLMKMYQDNFEKENQTHVFLIFHTFVIFPHFCLI